MSIPTAPSANLPPMADSGGMTAPFATQTPYGNVMYGASHAATYNPYTGQGQPGRDKGLGTEFTYNEMAVNVLEAVFRMSWAARKMINIPVNDMWALGRTWVGDDESAVEKMVEAEKKLKLHRKLETAMKAASLYGTSLAIMVPRDLNLLPEEMDPEKVGEDEIAHIWVVDKNSCQVETWQTDLAHEEFGEVWQYRVYQRIAGYPNFDRQVRYKEPHNQDGPSWVVHKSRVLRFDGLESVTTEGFWTGDNGENWGISILHPAMAAILRSENMQSAVGHLVSEASIPIMKVDGIKDVMMGRRQVGPGFQNIAAFNMMSRNLFHTLFMDVDDEIERLDYGFGGLPDIIDRYHLLLAAIADIPATRWMGQSPVGMDATGESDMTNYALLVESLQVKVLQPVLECCDIVVARNAGLEEPPEYEWHPLTSLREDTKAEILKIQTEAVSMAVGGQFVDESEARERLSQNEFWGELGPWTDEMAQGYEAEQSAMELEGQQAKAATMQRTQPSSSSSKST